MKPPLWQPVASTSEGPLDHPKVPKLLAERPGRKPGESVALWIPAGDPEA
jgi:hypothetical protein